jgi:hypothetical protein
MIKKHTLISVIETILAVEKKNNLYFTKINGINVYNHIRLSIFYLIVAKLGLYTKQSKPTVNLKKGLNFLINTIKTNDFKSLSCADILLIPHTRKIFYDGNYTDIYTTPLLNSLEYKPTILNLSSLSSNYSEMVNDTDILFFDYFIAKRKLYNYLNKIQNINKIEIYTLSNIICAEINQNINKEILQVSHLCNIINDALNATLLSIQFLKKLMPKLIIDVVSYGHRHITEAANYLGIPVIELQHSIISEYHLGYHFPEVEKNTLPSFPDYIFTFGEFWARSASFPLDKCRIIATGYPFQEIKYNDNQIKKSNCNSVLLISQKVLGDKFCKLAIDLSAHFKDKTFIIKLHPKQYDSLDELPSIQSDIPENLKIVFDKQTTIYDLIAISEWQIGVFSTAIYEGLSFGLKTIVYQFEGYQYMNELISQKICYKASSINDVINVINDNGESLSKNTHNSDYIFNKNSIQNMCRSINIIMDSHN